MMDDKNEMKEIGNIIRP